MNNCTSKITLLALFCIVFLLGNGPKEPAPKVGVTIKSLSTLGGPDSEAFAINNHGQIVGVSSTRNDANNNGANRAFLYEKGKITNLGVLKGCGSSEATGINNKGEIIGTSRAVAGCLVRHIGVQFADGQVTPLKKDPVNSFTPYGINSAGQFSGRFNFGGDIHACFVDSKVHDLGSLRGKDQRSEGCGINDRGDIAGVSWISDKGETRDFLYKDGKMIDLGTLPGDYTSHACGLNNRGDVVGWSAPAFQVCPEPRAILYSDGKMIDLNTLLPRNSGWVLRRANGINDNGQIVGMGVYRDHEVAFLLNLNGEK